MPIPMGPSVTGQAQLLRREAERIVGGTARVESLETCDDKVIAITIAFNHPVQPTDAERIAEKDKRIAELLAELKRIEDERNEREAAQRAIEIADRIARREIDKRRAAEQREFAWLIKEAQRKERERMYRDWSFPIAPLYPYRTIPTYPGTLPSDPYRIGDVRWQAHVTASNCQLRTPRVSNDRTF